MKRALRTKWLVLMVPMIVLGCDRGSSEAPTQLESELGGAQSGWLDQAQRHIAAREYWARDSGAGLQAPNRRQNLRTYFDSHGIRVENRAQGGGLLELSLESIGRGARRKALGPGRVASENGRVEIRRDGLVEWYENRPEGLEQGFVVERPPPGSGSVVLALAIEGARANERSNSIVLTTGSGRRLDYAHLVAWDATGQRLSASMSSPSEDRIEIAINDRGAVYPITIDPLLSGAPDSQIESNQGVAFLGSSVASAGDVNGDGFSDVIVGAPNYDAGEINEGAAFILLGTPSGVPDAGPLGVHAQIEADDAGAGLGSSVASAGDVNGDGYSDVIVGAAAYSVSVALSTVGAAFIFHGSPTGIADGNPASADARLEGDDSSGTFGSSVASAGDVNGDGYADVVVGAPRLTIGANPNEGAAFVYLGSSSGISHGGPATADTTLAGNQTNSRFGESVASAGDVNGDGYSDLIVGAGTYDLGGAFAGLAFIYEGGPLGIPDGGPLTADTQLDGFQSRAEFGSSVASAGDVNGDGFSDVIVGARDFDPINLNDGGAAFIFHGSATGVPDSGSAPPATRLDSDQANAAFGISVASAGDVNGDGYADVVVGADCYGTSCAGAVHLFLGSAAGIPDGGPGTADGQVLGEAFGRLGISVASAGDVNGDGYADLILGGWGLAAGEGSEGIAYIYHGRPDLSDGDPSNANTRFEGDQVDAQLGASVATGDFNGDGHADVLVGAPGYDAGQTDEGAAFLFLGGPGGMADGSPIVAVAQFESDQAASNFGFSVASAGDVDGDGDDDLLIGASNYENNESDEGAAFLFHGSRTLIPDGNPVNAAATLQANQPGALLGISVASAGDVNGDGYSDVVVGAFGYDDPESLEGAAFVFHGGRFGLESGDPSTAAAILQADQVFALMGRSVASAGDVNGDGYADVIVGAPRYDAGENDEGAAFVFHGSASGINSRSAANADAQLESDQPSAFLGQSVASAGDVNGDGYADVIAGAPLFDDPENQEGAAFVFLGSQSGVGDGDAASAHATFQGNQEGAQLGHSVASAGDVNGDGYADVIIGAHRFNVFLGGIDEGVASLFLGSAAGLADGEPFSADAAFFGLETLDLMGSSLAAGDLDGDGFSDLIIGAEGVSGGQTGEGGAFVFLAQGAPGRTTLPRQHVTGSSQADGVSSWGGFEGLDFDVSLIAGHPEGRGRVQLEVEWCPQGVAFETPLCRNQVSSSWTDVTASSGGVVLRETVSTLVAGELTRWRARVLHAPFSIDEPGISTPTNPRHGPWRRLSAQAHEADIRPLPEPAASLGIALGVAWLMTLRRSQRDAPIYALRPPCHRAI